MSKYRIGDDDFELDLSGIVGILDEEGELFWAIDLYAKGKTVEDLHIQPKLSFTRLPHPTGTDPSLHEIHFPNAVAYDSVNDEWIGDFYIHDAHFFRSEITLSRTSKTHFRIHWKGEVDTSVEGVPGEHFVPFEIIQEIAFHGIMCEFTDEQESKTLLKGVCDLSEYFWIDAGNEFFDASFLSTKNLDGKR